jgi:hypothetical protein
MTKLLIAMLIFAFAILAFWRDRKRKKDASHPVDTIGYIDSGGDHFGDFDGDGGGH